MPPVSSLVFVVILAVWAVYLVQHWVRRRDHLATARSVDRFSEAMRVLERRRSLPVPRADTHPRSYAASPLRPARPGRPEVVVKHARTARGATAVAPSRAQRRARLVARVRALGLLAGWIAMVALVGLAMAGVLPRWSALVGVAACAVSVTLVRWSVARQRATRRAARASAPARRRESAEPPRAGTHPRHHSAAASAHRSAAPPVRHRSAPGAVRGQPAAGRPSREGHEFSAQSVAVTLRTPSRRGAARESGPTDAQAGPTPYDLNAVEASLAGAARAGTGAEREARASATDHPAPAPQPPAADGTWEPVPVPPPTYTLKAKAYRPAPTGSASLPADGTEMALAEEFEDLPRIDRVG